MGEKSLLLILVLGTLAPAAQASGAGDPLRPGFDPSWLDVEMEVRDGANRAREDSAAQRALADAQAGQIEGALLAKALPSQKKLLDRLERDAVPVHGIERGAGPGVAKTPCAAASGERKERRIAPEWNTLWDDPGLGPVASRSSVAFLPKKPPSHQVLRC